MHHAFWRNLIALHLLHVESLISIQIRIFENTAGLTVLLFLTQNYIVTSLNMIIILLMYGGLALNMTARRF